MNKERLLKLADFLETVPDEHFDIGSWRNGQVKDEPGAVTDTALVSHACGTTGCAVGWACAMPEFQAQGLGFDLNKGYFSNTSGTPTFFCAETGETLRAWHAVRQFFDLKFWEDYHLFSGTRYEGQATAKDVAVRIREFVGMHE